MSYSEPMNTFIKKIIRMTIFTVVVTAMGVFASPNDWAAVGFGAGMLVLHCFGVSIIAHEMFRAEFSAPKTRTRERLERIEKQQLALSDSPMGG